ncbi:signal transduction histidine kinase/ligand-binding sensor domain-containing protein/DNA-binding response OmpR family regulator [Flavobacterium sp. 2755]|uniref:hybrid sensor histidine kinase/response regulator transcription factor n=1 Tax=Flavobacterium sp. 2755 TaxID=2817765 RepID=UPI0028678115|nr:two-component regulator propeller domain-containing protein [Flavobacterium sp. 2755]MDR6764439.1 signal transduction histidine kinase/ligand-binding sensor domain-containing protein/DNA-binding response OmpR family regulator [Flavobacterium sp. 2755]
MKDIKIYLLSFILFFSIPFDVKSQGSDLYFDHIDYDVSFSQSMISSIHQTKKGFIWIGTANGLISYDGYNFLRYVYNKDILNTISNNHINVILEDNQKELWIGTNNGLNLFNKKENNFLRVDVQKVKGGRNYISSIIQDDQNRIWIGTFGGIKRLNKKEYLLEEISNDHNSPFRKSRVLSLFYDHNYGVLVGTSKGLECFDPKNGSRKELPKTLKENDVLIHSKIWKIIKEKNGDLWFATEANGVFHYDTAKNLVINYLQNPNSNKSLSSNWINDIVAVDANTIWFATKNGLCAYKKDKKEFTKYQHNPLTSYSLSDDDIKCFLKDRHDDIWIGTNGGGVNFFQKTNTNFTNVREVIKPNFGLNSALVNAVAKETDGSLWVGTNGGGLNFLDFRNNQNSSYLIDTKDFDKSVNMITALVNQNQQNLFCGTFNGLYKFNKNSKIFSKIPLSPNPKDRDRPITSLLLDHEDLWVGTNGNGLKKILPDGTIESYMADGTSNALSDNFITDIANRENGLWIATQYGLNYFDKKLKRVTKIYKSGKVSGLPNNSLTVMFTDSKNRFWVGSESGGINLLNEKLGHFFEINRNLGFTDETIKSISEDSEGNIWVSDNNLLYKIRTKKFKTNPNISDFEITSYSAKDGLKVKQFSNNSSLRLNNNELVFGSSNGLIHFNPFKLIKTPDNAEIVLTKLIVNNEEIRPGNKEVNLQEDISETQEITLNHDQGYIGLEFSAMNFVSPEKNEYAYKLESSFNKDDWHIIGSQHYINLTNLNSGTYLLKIKTSDGGGKWNPAIKTLKIIMLPPWWKTWWAFIFYFGLLLAGSVLLFRFLRNRELLKQAFYLEQVEKERQEELYKMKLDFFTNVSHEIRTPLTLISGPVEELLSGAEKNSNLEQKLKVIKNNSDRLLKLVNELMDFRKAEKGSMKIYCEQQDIVSFCFDIYESFRGFAVEKKIDYKFVLNINTALIYFDKNQMEKVIYNLLSNAFKFTSKNGRITLAVEQKEESDSIEIKVKDNGIGIPENRKKKIFKNFFQLDDRGSTNMGSGIGLALSKSIVELHHGEIKVQTEADANFNTIFTITLKKGKDHFKKSQIVENAIKIEENSNPISDVETEIETYEAEYFEEQENSTKKTVLVIEDNEEVLSFVYDILHSDYKVLKFTNGLKALEYMEKEIPDLIVTDVMMPEMDGFELCKILKTNQNTNHIPVILLTAKSSTLNKIEGLSLGADAYISKPFSIEELKLTIANLLSAKEIMRQKYGERFISDSEQENINTPEGLFVKKLTQIIEANIDNTDFDVNDLVREIGMSRTVLYKKVQTLTNYSVAGFIKNMRLKKAASLLMNTSYSVSEVTYMVGFNDRKHFSKEFKKFYNLSPTEYKSSQLKN